MNIAIVTSSSYFSYLLISDLLQNHHHDVVCLILTPNKIKGKTTLQTAIHVLIKTGWSNFCYKVISCVWFTMAEYFYKIGVVKHCVRPESLAAKYSIDIFKTGNCNSQETLDYLKIKNIDILLSINVYQRILEPLLSIPKISAVNNHFGLLPKYRGMAPYIWAMANNEKEIGLSIHHMVLKFDAGKLIKQERMELYPGDSAMGVYLRACAIARKLITKVVYELESNPDAGFDQTGDSSYFSMPTHRCIKDLKKNGFVLWKLKDLFSVFCGELSGESLP